MHSNEASKFRTYIIMTYCPALLDLCIYLMFVLAVVATDAERCDKLKCFVALSHYKDLNCSAVYENPDDCCPIRYNCNHLRRSTLNKCLVNGRFYEIGEKLRKEDANRCEEDCVCISKGYGYADFDCTAGMNRVCPVYVPPRSSNCYLIDSLQHCCQTEAICSEDPKNRSICHVDGEIYRSGDFFVPLDKPHLSCMCRPGFKGEYIEPFCIEQNRWFWSNLHASYRFFRGCVPIYNTYQERLVGHTSSWRCQKPNDKILLTYVPEEPKNSNKCIYLFLDMVIDEEWHIKANNDSRNCNTCLCLVPPLPYCLQTQMCFI